MVTRRGFDEISCPVPIVHLQTSGQRGLTRRFDCGIKNYFVWKLADSVRCKIQLLCGWRSCYMEWCHYFERKNTVFKCVKLLLCFIFFQYWLYVILVIRYHIQLASSHCMKHNQYQVGRKEAIKHLRIQRHIYTDLPSRLVTLIEQPVVTLIPHPERQHWCCPFPCPKDRFRWLRFI